MQNKVTQDKEFRTFCPNEFVAEMDILMKNPKSIKELLKSGGKRLSSLSAQVAARTTTLDHILAALPAELASTVATAGIQNGKLTIGVTGAAWAARLRYATESLRTQVAASLGTDITSVRIKVIPPRA
jgi:hypothetical protein